jgi:hypothetical protein
MKVCIHIHYGICMHSYRVLSYQREQSRLMSSDVGMPKPLVHGTDSVDTVGIMNCM